MGILESCTKAVKAYPATTGDFGDCEVPKQLQFVLGNRGIKKLYRHQCEGIGKIQDGKNVVVAAPTASGKSEIFIIPIVQAALLGKCCLVIYPTKALSRDQLARWREFALLGVQSSVYDGDVTQHQREKIREAKPQIVVTNIDMLHHMLMHARLFEWLWQNLSFVVLDELHTYSGALGSHAANIIWRTKRLSRIFGGKEKKLQFVCSSATIANPQDFASRLFGEDFELVSAEGAPSSGVKSIIAVPQGESYTTASVKIAKELGRRSLIFGNSHNVVERLGLIARDAGYPLAVYRAGLDAAERKRLESSFRNGFVSSLATTSALELGIDIGGVDGVILCGHPGTSTQVRQRIGRAGRRGEEAVAVFVPRDSPLDQYFADNPDQYFDGKPESCYLNERNPQIERNHLLAASRDHPLRAEELDSERAALAESLLQHNLLKKWGERLIPSKDGIEIAKRMGIRSSGESISIVDASTKKEIGEREEYMAMRELFEGAIYLHGGARFESVRLDLENKKAYVERVAHGSSEYTSALHSKEAEVIEELAKRQVLGRKLAYGRLLIRDSIEGYTVKDYFQGRALSRHFFEEPLQYEFETLGIWCDFEDGMASANFANGLHALEHVLIGMMPAVSGAASAEIGGISYPLGTMFVYDGVAYGSGVTKIVFDRYAEVFEMAKDRLEKCECEAGCPKCIFSPQCGNDNRYLDKKAAKEIAEGVLGRK
jgi:DEAD/DEAH box helicase domain-containing protein